MLDHREFDLAFLSRVPSVPSSRAAGGDRKQGLGRWEAAVERARVMVDANRAVLGILPTETLHYAHHPIYCYVEGDEDFLTQILVSNEAGVFVTVWVGNDSLPRRIYLRPRSPRGISGRAD